MRNALAAESCCGAFRLYKKFPRTTSPAKSQTESDECGRGTAGNFLPTRCLFILPATLCSAGFQAFDTTHKSGSRHMRSLQAFLSSFLNSSYCHLVHPRRSNRTASDASVYDFLPMPTFHNIPLHVQDSDV